MSAPLNARDVLLQSTTPRFSTQPGQDGLTTATVFIYQRNNTGVAPAVPSVSTTYTFDPAGLAGLNNGWSFTLPDAAAGAFLFVSRALAASTTATDVLASLDWSAAQLMAKDGAAGAPGANGSTSLYPPLTDAGWTSSYGSTSTVAVTGAPSGATARRSGVGVDSGLNHTAYYPIDRTRAYRVRFWARASGAGSGEPMANGVLYFCLRQYLENYSPGPNNSGRDPYKPVSITAGANQVWTEHSFTWSSADWQAGVTQVRPDYLLNYRPDAVARVGFWEVQGFEMQDVTEVITAQAAAEAYALAKSNLAEIQAKAYADGVIDAEEARAIADATAKAETARVAAVNAAAIDATTKANAAKTAAEAYALAQANLARTTAEAHADGIVTAEETRAIADATAKAEAARVAAVNAAAADATAKANVAATTATWTGIASRPPDSALLNSAIRLGGRNFYLNSTVFTEQANNAGNGVQALVTTEAQPYYRITASSSVSTYSSVVEFPKIPLNTVCVISVDVRVPVAGTVGFYAGLGAQSVPGNQWVRIFYSFTYTGARVTGLTYGGTYLDARNWKMEIGNIGTDWTPAPEDVLADAQTKADAAANWAVSTAATYASAQATLARTNAEAYADGVVDAEEARAIADATAKAEAARVAAVNAAAADATAKANLAATTSTWAGTLNRPTDVEIYNNQDSIIRAPGGALLVTQDPLLTGCIKVRLPVLWSDTMMKFAVDIYEYIGGYSCSIEIAGYNYSAGSWYNVTARVIGGSNVEYPVYFGHDGTKACIFIGEASTQWTYPQIRVRDFFAGYGGVSKSNWESGWQITISSIGPQNISAQVLDTYPAADWSKIPNRDGKPANGATVGAPAGTYVAGTLAETLAAQAAAGNAVATAPQFTITQKANSDFSTPIGNYYRNVGSFVAAVNNAQGTVKYAWTITGGENISVLASGVGTSTLNLQGKSVAATGADINITCTAVDGNRTAIMSFLHSVDFYE